MTTMVIVARREYSNPLLVVDLVSCYCDWAGGINRVERYGAAETRDTAKNCGDFTELSP